MGVDPSYTSLGVLVYYFGKFSVPEPRWDWVCPCQDLEDFSYGDCCYCKVLLLYRRKAQWLHYLGKLLYNMSTVFIKRWVVLESEKQYCKSLIFFRHCRRCLSGWNMKEKVTRWRSWQEGALAIITDPWLTKKNSWSKFFLGKDSSGWVDFSL